MNRVSFVIQGRVDRIWRFLAVVIVVVIAVLFFVDWRAFQTASSRADETRQLQDQTDKLLSSVTDAETSQRGYLLTGDKKYLIPYDKAVRDIPGEMVALAASAAAVPRAARQVENIQAMVHDKMADLKRTIEVRDEAGDEAAMALMRTDEGRVAMDDVRAACKALLSSEYMRLYDLNKASESHANGFLFVVFAGCGGLVFLLWRLGAAVDSVVHEREEAARGIEESRQLLQTTLDGIGDAVIVTDAIGVIRFMNPVAARLTGWSGADAAHQPLSQVFHVVDDRTRHKIEDPVLTAERQVADEALVGHTALISKDGAEISIESSAAPIRTAGDKVQGAVLVFRDVTARRIAARELERWKQIFAGAAFGMFIADSRKGVIVDTNPTFAAMHGYSVNELLGKSLQALIPPECTGEFVLALKAAGEKGRHMFEGRHMRRDATEFPSLIDVTRFYDGKTELLAGYCSDITERKRFEDALKESEERFRTLASALPQLVWAATADGLIEYVNEVWISYAGWKSGDEARKYLPLFPWKDLLHPEDQEEYFIRWTQSLRSGNAFEVQARLRRASDGAYRWFLCRAVPVRGRDGRIVRWLGGCTDIQQQMDAASQLKLAIQALQQSNADLEQFAYAASHDLQEPLRMVSIYSQLLKEEYSDTLHPHALSYIDFAVNGARRMSRLLTDLLAYSRVANASPETSPRADARRAVETALLNLATVVEQTSATVEVGDLPSVQVREIHLVQLFQNLIGNALKYRRQDEHPLIRIGAREEPGGSWLFSISDNGIGIEPEYLQQIFGIFKRLHGPAYEGTGIGLALCQKIVERAGGQIWVESEPGIGSTFFFRLQSAAGTAAYELACHNSAGRG